MASLTARIEAIEGKANNRWPQHLPASEIRRGKAMRRCLRAMYNALELTERIDSDDQIRELAAHIREDALTDADKLVLDSLPVDALTTLATSAHDFMLLLWEFGETY